MCCRLSGKLRKHFPDMGSRYRNRIFGAFDVYGIPIPHARKFFAKLFFKKA